MKEKDIIDAYLQIRKTNNSIPDEVLDFMKLAAVEKINKKCEHYFVSSVAYKGAKICAKCGIYK